MLSPAMKPDLPGARLRFDRFDLDEAEARLTCAGEAASGAMQILPANELERLVRQTFPEKPGFSAEAELAIGPRRQPIVTFVHGGAARFSTAHSGTGSAARPCSRLRISCSTEIMQTEFDEAGGTLKVAQISQQYVART